MIAVGALPPLLAPLLNAFALLLALGFRRNRAVLVLIVVTLAAFALGGLAPVFSERTEAVRMFAPWFLLAIAAMPERGLLARRNLILMLLIIGAVWFAASAPDSWWVALRKSLPLAALPFAAPTSAAVIVAVAAGACLLRYVMRAGPMEAGLCLVLAAVAYALSPLARADGTSLGFAIAGASASLAVLYASYRMAFIDVLTGLPNRRALDEALSRLSGTYAVAMVDVDHFKKFNDSHGHAAGDLVLKSVAAQLRLTRGARPFRYGGEEFCLLFVGAHSKRAAEACEQARERVENSRVRIRPAPASQRRRAQAVKRAEATDVRVTASIGLAERDAQTRSAEDVLKAADQALYRAKGKGRNRVVEA